MMMILQIYTLWTAVVYAFFLEESEVINLVQITF